MVVWWCLGRCWSIAPAGVALADRMELVLGWRAVMLSVGRTMLSVGCWTCCRGGLAMSALAHRSWCSSRVVELVGSGARSVSMMGWGVSAACCRRLPGVWCVRRSRSIRGGLCCSTSIGMTLRAHARWCAVVG